METQAFAEAIQNHSQPCTLYRAGGREYRGMFLSARITSESVPKDWNVFEFRKGYEDYDGSMPFVSELRNGTIYNGFCGTFATKEDIGLPNGKSLYFCGDNESSEQLGILEGEFDYDLDEPDD